MMKARILIWKLLKEKASVKRQTATGNYEKRIKKFCEKLLHLCYNIAVCRSNTTVKKENGELAKQCFLDCLEPSEAAISACVLQAESFENDLLGFTSLQLIALTSLLKMRKVNPEHLFSQNTMPVF